MCSSIQTLTRTGASSCPLRIGWWVDSPNGRTAIQVNDLTCRRGYCRNFLESTPIVIRESANKKTLRESQSQNTAILLLERPQEWSGTVGLNGMFTVHLGETYTNRLCGGCCSAYCWCLFCISFKDFTLRTNLNCWNRAVSVSLFFSFGWTVITLPSTGAEMSGWSCVWQFYLRSMEKLL